MTGNGVYVFLRPVKTTAQADSFHRIQIGQGINVNKILIEKTVGQIQKMSLSLRTPTLISEDTANAK